MRDILPSSNGVKRGTAESAYAVHINDLDRFRGARLQINLASNMITTTLGLMDQTHHIKSHLTYYDFPELPRQS
ncbi:hypothetical protein M426DRAFT_324102 [Hypoxylon sp. CI-4A]|nr:hypothetical protein M426DRAFT_324102 [Hypoxylon sp. CI-4A]